MAGVPVNENSVPIVAGGSFYAAMQILPRSRYEAIYAVYAFCRPSDFPAVIDGMMMDVTGASEPQPGRRSISIVNRSHVPSAESSELINSTETVSFDG